MRRIIIVAAVVATWLWTGSSASAAETPTTPRAGKEGWVALFDGKTTAGWHVRNPKRPNHWTASDGLLINAKNEGTDLISDVKLMDHELHIEFNVPPGGNSGVYLQGRYEVQVSDSSRANRLTNNMCGAVYGRIAPKVLVKPKEEPITEEIFKKRTNWQPFDIKFYSVRLGPEGKVAQKARITVIHNGVPIIENAEIDGVTGSAVDNKEGTAAALMLQGDHTRMEYRNILYRPIQEKSK